MNQQNYSQVIQTALSVIEDFEKECKRFIFEEYELIKYYSPEDNMISAFEILSEIPKISYELQEYAMINDEEFKKERKYTIYFSLQAIQVRLEYIAINGVWTLDELMEETWRYLGKVYDELNMLLGFQIEFNYDEKLRVIEEQRNNYDREKVDLSEFEYCYEF